MYACEGRMWVFDKEEWGAGSSRAAAEQQQSKLAEQHGSAVVWWERNGK